MKLSATAICLAACLLSPVQAKRKSSDGDSACFKKQGDTYEVYSDKIYAASAEQDCSGSEKQCSVTSEDIEISEKPSLNVTTDKEDEIIDIISEMTGLSVDEDASDVAGGGMQCTRDVNEGDKIYAAYFPKLTCVNGTMGDCVDGVEAGLGVKACYPATTGQDDDGDDKNDLYGRVECRKVNDANTPDVKFKPAEGAAAGLTADITLLSLSFLAVGSFWALPSL